jgi:hypothetical protein
LDFVVSLLAPSDFVDFFFFLGLGASVVEASVVPSAVDFFLVFVLPLDFVVEDFFFFLGLGVSVVEASVATVVLAPSDFVVEDFFFFFWVWEHQLWKLQ